MIVGTEWIIDAVGCDAESLRDLEKIKRVFSRILNDLKLKSLNEMWHKFDGEAGLTGLVLLTESHLACHTYPEFQSATFNLYCCKKRPEWNWEANLKEILGAMNVTITKIERGESNAVVPPVVVGGTR